jgi:hypothetical protein
MVDFVTKEPFESNLSTVHAEMIHWTQERDSLEDEYPEPIPHNYSLTKCGH